MDRLETLKNLCEKYDVIFCAPISTRQEAQVLLRLVHVVGRDLIRFGAEKANKSDLAPLSKLQEELKEEIEELEVFLDEQN